MNCLNTQAALFQEQYRTPAIPSLPPPATPAPDDDWILKDSGGNTFYQGNNPDFNAFGGELGGGFCYTDVYGGLVSVAYDPGVNVFTVSYVPSWLTSNENTVIVFDFGYGGIEGFGL